MGAITIRVSRVGALIVVILTAFILLQFLRTPPYPSAPIHGDALEPLLTSVDAANSKICIVSADSYGFPKMGGTATAFWQLAATLKKITNQRIKWLSVNARNPLNPDCDTADNSTDNEIFRLYQKNGLQLVCLCSNEVGGRGAALHVRVAGINVWQTAWLTVAHWFLANPTDCNVVYVHEWGGLASYLLSVRDARPDLFGPPSSPSLRIVVNVHGGHFWASSATLYRPTDATSLEIEEAERFSVEHADAVVFPSRHMQDYLQQRGWDVANGDRDIRVIPNIPPAHSLPKKALRQSKQWTDWSTIVFYSRLEDRKGLNIFLNVVRQLSEDMPKKTYRVVLLGGFGLVDGVPADHWLQSQLDLIRWPVEIHNKSSQLQAWDTIRKPGTLVVVPSLIENQPYVVVECAIFGLPTILFNTGGIEEMLEPSSANQVAIEPTYDALYNRLRKWLQTGLGYAPVLRPELLTAQDTWIRFNQEFSGKPASRATISKKSIALFELQSGSLDAVKVRMKVCSQEVGTLHGRADIVIIVPHGFMPLNDPETTKRVQTALRMLFRKEEISDDDDDEDTGEWGKTQKPVGAVILGTHLTATGQTLMPMSPFWVGRLESAMCAYQYPVAVDRRLFCTHYTAEARTFSRFETWQIPVLMEQNGLGVIPLPMAAFHYSAAMEEKLTGDDEARAWRQCDSNRNPLQKLIPPRLLLNLRGEAFQQYGETGDKLIWPLYSADFSSVQGERGWHYGYLTGPNLSADIRWFQWQPERDPLGLKGRGIHFGAWGCSHDFPFIAHTYLHPCRARKKQCCGSDHGAPVLRYSPFQRVPSGKMLLRILYAGQCGDGVTIVVRKTTKLSIMSTTDSVQQGPQPQKESSEVVTEIPLEPRIISTQVYERVIGPGLDPSVMWDFILFPRDNMDCDGVNVEIKYLA